MSASPLVIGIIHTAPFIVEIIECWILVFWSPSRKSPEGIDVSIAYIASPFHVLIRVSTILEPRPESSLIQLLDNRSYRFTQVNSERVNSVPFELHSSRKLVYIIGLVCPYNNVPGVSARCDYHPDRGCVIPGCSYDCICFRLYAL